MPALKNGKTEMSFGSELTFEAKCLILEGFFSGDFKD